ncbi:hypothetical protein L1987_09199 [Smallanthus sonchifolius]|uniref:Uncharacterized protein n=1 Tax=Smallanthus sonchifolius TaxID=185202 RepID=A0ACB9JPG3_9ASTR|nr:hypothetical protein L1987_09199 [Smallanthus sonchifolius]
MVNDLGKGFRLLFRMGEEAGLILRFRYYTIIIPFSCGELDGSGALSKILTGQTVLNWSAVRGAVQVADLLLQEGAHIHGVDAYGYQASRMLLEIWTLRYVPSIPHCAENGLEPTSVAYYYKEEQCNGMMGLVRLKLGIGCFGQIPGATPAIPGMFQNMFPLPSGQFGALPVMPVQAMTKQKNINLENVVNEWTCLEKDGSLLKVQVDELLLVDVELRKASCKVEAWKLSICLLFFGTDFLRSKEDAFSQQKHSPGVIYMRAA